jgi:Flp pilus assembly protein TadD
LAVPVVAPPPPCGPDFADAHNHLGLILLERGEVEPARAPFEEAICLVPRDADARNNLGVALKREGRLHEAAREYGEAIPAWGP